MGRYLMVLWLETLFPEVDINWGQSTICKSVVRTQYTESFFNKVIATKFAQNSCKSCPKICLYQTILKRPKCLRIYVTIVYFIPFRNTHFLQNAKLHPNQLVYRRFKEFNTHMSYHPFVQQTLLFGSHDEVVSIIFVVDNVLQINACDRMKRWSATTAKTQPAIQKHTRLIQHPLPPSVMNSLAKVFQNLGKFQPRRARQIIGAGNPNR